MPLIYALAFSGCIGWICGVFIGILWGWSGIFILVLISGILFFWYFKRYWILSTLVISLIIGWGWSFLVISGIQDEQTRLGESLGWDGFTHTITGTVNNLISINEYNKRYVVKVQSIDDKKVSLSVALILPLNLSLTSGDTITSVGRFRFPKDTPEYAGEKTLWYRGLIAEFQSFQNKKIEPEKRPTIARIQLWFDQKLREVFPDPGYTVLSGILFGQRTHFDSTLRDHLKASGLMHIMVVSGGNIMMLIIFLSLFIRSFPVILRIGIIVVTVFGFCLIVGGDMPVWRAALMGTIGYTASLWGYRFPGLLLPIGVAVLISFWSPLALVYDIGLQLSFLSVVCIIVWGKTLAKKLSFLGNFFAEASALTVAATIGTLPITIYYFSTFSLVGPIANIFAAPAIPLLMYGGIITLCMSIISPTGTYWIGYIPWITTNYLMEIIDIFGGQQWSLITLPIEHYKTLFLILSLGILLLFIVKNQQRQCER